MKTKLLSMLMLISVSVNVFAYGEFKVGNLYYRIINNSDEVEVVKTPGTMSVNYSGLKSIVIPATITYQSITYKVTRIYSNAFDNCPDLETLEIGENITKIERQAFDSPKLSTIIWQAKNCNGWDYYYSPFYEPVQIGAVGSYDKITSITFTDKVESIPSYLCLGMSNLQTVRIGKNVKSIGTSNSQYFKNIYITDLVAYCGISISGNFPAHKLFLNDVEVTNLEIPQQILSINNNTFNGCTSLVSLTIHEAVTNIGAGAFCNCSSLQNITFNAIQCADFSDVIYDQQVSSIVLGESVKHIPAYLCKGTSITSLTIPENVESIGQYAILLCSNLQNVAWNAKDCELEGGLREANLTYYTTYGSTSYGSCLINNVSFGPQVQRIPDELCRFLYDITDIQIPNSVLYIGNHAFENCENLTSLTLGNGIVEIGDYAFNECESLESITLPISIGKIGKSAFQRCYSLSTIVIPGSVSNLGNYAFANCGLTQVTIEQGVQRLSNYMFENCSEIVNVTLPSSLRSIGDGAFKGCSAWRVALPDSLIHIGANALNNTFTYNLDRNWDNGVLYVDNYLIQGIQSKGLSNTYNVKDGTKIIADGAFQGANNLTAITVSESVKHIGNRAFYNCSKMAKAISLPKHLETIGDSAMYFRTNTNWSYTLYLPRTLQYIGVAAFWSDNNSKAAITDIYAYMPNPLEISSYDFKLQNSISNTPVYVYADDANKYFSADVWKQFDIQIISAPSITVTDSIEIDITRTEATFKWLKIAQAKTYILVVLGQSGDTIETVAINEHGEVKYDDRRLQKSSMDSSNGFQYTISGLKNNTHYTYVLQAKNAAGNVLEEYSDSFVTGLRYTVRFVDWDDALLKEEIVRESESATPPENPSREGFTFTGWDKEYTNINSDIIIKAQYERDVVYYTVTFLDWDGSELFVEQVEEGQDAIGPSVLPYREGYTFTGWSKPTTNIQSNLTVIAQYQLNEGIEDVLVNGSTPNKIMTDGQIYILRGDKIYTLQGQEVK